MKKILASLLLAALSLPLFANEKNLVAQKSFEYGKITDFDFNLTYEEVFFEKTMAYQLSIEIYCNNKKKIPEFEITNETFYLTSVVHRVYPGDVCKVYIYCPDNTKFDNVKISSASGQISIKNMEAINADIKAVSGKITISNLSLEEDLNLKTTSGSIKAENIYAESTAISSTSGSITVANIATSEMENKTTSGKISLDQFTGEYLLLKSTSGKMISKNTGCNYFTVEGTSGAVELELNKKISASSSIKTVSGTVSLHVPKNAGFNVSVSTTSGRLYDEINDNSFTPRSGYNKSYYGGGSEIAIKTTSGSITIDN